MRSPGDLIWRVLVWAGWALGICVGLALIAGASSIRSPALLSWRPWPIILIVTAAMLYAGIAWRWPRTIGMGFRATAMSLGVIALALGIWREGSMHLLKSSVLSTPAAELRAVGGHLIVGFGRIEDVVPLVTRAAVAGVFFARRNVRNRSEAEIARDISSLQTLRRASGLPPLWIATDQEGGIVAAMSPPLPQPPALASLAHAGELVVDAAKNAGRDLACVGVNLNFAPVVDRNYRVIAPGGGLTQISRRAISGDERIIALTARDYCRELADSGVQCTIKHFPGIGSVKDDTHQGKASLPELRDEDLFPFHELAREEPPWIMLSHVTVESLDADRPASASAKVIDILRKDWGFNGILVTDDVSMRAYTADFETNAVDTMLGGADFLLVSYDPDLAYVALDELLRARRNRPELSKALAASGARVARHPPLTPACRRLALR